MDELQWQHNPYKQQNHQNQQQKQKNLFSKQNLFYLSVWVNIVLILALMSKISELDALQKAIKNEDLVERIKTVTREVTEKNKYLERLKKATDPNIVQIENPPQKKGD